MAKQQSITGIEPAHAHGLDRRTFDHFARLPEGVNYCPPWIDETRREAVEKAGANVPRRTRDKGSASTIRQSMLESSSVQPTVVRDVPENQIVDLENPEVAAHVAAVLVKHLMDASKAARELQPSLRPADQAILAHQIRNSPEVRVHLQKQLEAFGLSESAKRTFFATVWRHALNDDPANERKQIAALRLLARGFGLGENSAKEFEKPATLRIESLENGLLQMGLTPNVLATIPAAEFREQEDENEDLNQEETQ